MFSITPLLQTPIVYYAIILTIVSTIIQVISRTGFRRSIPEVSDRLVFAVLLIYVFLSILLMNINVDLFPYLHATMLAFILLSILSSSRTNSRILPIATFAIALMPAFVAVSNTQLLPLGDDARMIGFTGTIAENGRWIPFKYEENPYYQPFHLIPVIEYILALVPGFGLDNISCYYLLLKLNLYFVYFIFIYLVMKKLTHDNLNPLVAVLFVSVTPPLALTEVVPQNYAIVIFLVTSFLLLYTLEAKSGKVRNSILPMLTLLTPGVIAHATYTIMLLLFIVPFIILKSEQFKNIINITYSVTFLISFTYWNRIYILDELINPTISAIGRLIELLTGGFPYTPFQGVEPWYTGAESSFFVAWALIPAMATSFLLFAFFKIISRKHDYLEEHFKIAIVMGLLGLGGTILNFILRTLPTFGGRYFYWLYLLMLPSSIFLIANTRKKIISLTFSILLISVISFYGIQDPTLAGNTYGKYIGWADTTTWTVSHSLIQTFPVQLSVYGDQRITSTLFAVDQIFNNGSVLSFDVGKPLLIITGSDNIWKTYLRIGQLQNLPDFSEINGPRSIMIFSTNSFNVYYFGN